MPTLAGKLTLLDLANQKNPDGTLAAVAEVLTKDNEIMLDVQWTEANDTTSHRITRRTSKPTGSFRPINAGVAAEKSSTKVVREDIGMLDAISETDVEIVRSSPNPMALRMQEAATFIEGMGDTLVDTLVYGNSALDMEKFTGLAPRMASLVSGGRVLTAGGSANRTSVFIVKWGLDTVHMVYPKGSSVGLEHEDRGVDLVADANGNKFRAYVDYFSLKAGLVVRDDRCIGRLANIDTTAGAVTGLFDIDQVIRITNRMPKRGVGAGLYMNEEIVSQLEIQAKDKTNVYYGPDDAFGRPVLYVRSHPVRLTDGITNAETAVA